MRTRRNYFFVLLLLSLVLLTPFLGAERLSLSDLNKFDSLSYRIFWELRFPRWLLTLGVGGMLAVLGATYQNLFRNPLSEPYVLGVSSAVTLGVVLGEFFFRQPTDSWGSLLCGMILALLLILFLTWFASSRWGSSSEKVILFGLGCNFVLSSILFLVLSFQFQSVGGGAMRWFFGFIPWVETQKAIVFLLGGVGFTIGIGIFSQALEALRLGDSVARTLGVSPQLTRNLFLLFTSVGVAVTVSVSGTIGFVGLVIPHLCRMIFKPSSFRILLPQAFLLGASFLVLCDGLSRALVPPFEFPVGVMTTLIGGPLFLVVLWRRN